MVFYGGNPRLPFSDGLTERYARREGFGIYRIIGQYGVLMYVEVDVTLPMEDCLM